MISVPYIIDEIALAALPPIAINALVAATVIYKLHFFYHRFLVILVLAFKHHSSTKLLDLMISRQSNH